MFCQDLRAMNNGESTYSSGWRCGRRGCPHPTHTLLKTPLCHEEVEGAQAGPAQKERATKDGVEGPSALSYGDSVSLLRLHTRDRGSGVGKL